MPSEKKEKVIQDVSVFVYGQIHSLPGRYVLLLRLGLWFFYGMVFLRTWRRFGTLSVERQMQVVSGWAYGRWASGRQLFRLLRSITLLAFYEHPVVMEKDREQAI